MVMNFRDHKIEITGVEMIVIPQGYGAKPLSEIGYKALLIEPKGAPNTGSVQNEKTIGTVERI